MANETTTTTMNDITYSAVIEPILLDYAYDWIVVQQFMRKFSLVGKPSNALDVPKLDSDMGTVGDGGSGVDAEFDATQASDLSTNTAMDTSKVTLTCAEVALRRSVTDNVYEDSLPGIDLADVFLMDAARVLTAVCEDDASALLGSFSNTSGTTTSDLTVAQMLAAQVGIRKRGFRAPDGVVYCIDEQQVDDLEAALIAISTSGPNYVGAQDRLLGVNSTANNGMGNGWVMNFRGYPVYSCGLTDTANTGADVTGACFVPTSPGNDPHASLGYVEKRPFRMEVQRDASLRANELIFSRRYAVGELHDGSGTSIITDA